MNEDTFYLVPEEFYYSMSRDVSEKERNHKSFSWWEILVYLCFLAVAFAATTANIK